MAKKRRHSARRFALGMIVYALVFIVFLAIGLRIFWGYIDAYEKAQPKHAIDSYVESFDSAHIRALSEDFVSSLDHRIQSEEEAYALIEDLFRGELRYSKNSVESTEDRLVFAILSDKRMLGTMALSRSGDGSDTVWTVSDESFDFSDLLNSAEILAPEEWQISCNGTLLGEEFITETGIRYPSMEEAYDYGFDLPMLVRYQIGNYIGEAQISALNADGNEAQLQDDPAAYTLRDRCTEDQRTRMEDFTRRFLPLYIAFMSNTNHNAYDNYARVHPYLLPGSDLESRFYNAIAGQVYSHSKGDVLHDVVVHGVYELDNGSFLIDVDYMVDTTGNAGTIENEAGMLIVAEDQGSQGIFASELFIK
ncbi:MAG: hypothetical protein IJP64_00170 [Oscillospiraceae bacterium]|nr:hypothetical protein [Oscillospiraceae bacterium]